MTPTCGARWLLKLCCGSNPALLLRNAALFLSSSANAPIGFDRTIGVIQFLVQRAGRAVTALVLGPKSDVRSCSNGTQMLSAGNWQQASIRNDFTGSKSRFPQIARDTCKRWFIVGGCRGLGAATKWRGRLYFISKKSVTIGNSSRKSRFWKHRWKPEPFQLLYHFTMTIGTFHTHNRPTAILLPRPFPRGPRSRGAGCMPEI